MPADLGPVASHYVDRLTETDLRLLAAAGAARDAKVAKVAKVATSFVDLLSCLGAHRRAVATAVLPTGDNQLLANIAERFDDARRALNVISDKHLFPHGNPWFSTPWSTPEAGEKLP
jgi:hypothetical protein